MRTLYQTFGRVAVVMVLVLCTTFAWAQSTDTKVTYNAAGTPVISKADAPAPTKNGQPAVAVSRQNQGASGAQQTLSQEAAQALKTKPAMTTGASTEPRFTPATMDAWVTSFKTWLSETPGAKAALTQDEYNFVANGDYYGLYKHTYMTSNPEAAKRAQAVK